MANLTPYARKFGVAPNDLELHPSKSGLSPLGPVPPLTERLLVQSADDRAEIDEFQQEQLCGFTSQKLVDLGAITTSELNPNNLTNPLDPLLERDRWMPPFLGTEQCPYYPIEGTDEVWNAANDRVWNCMLPSLRLVSVILSHLPKHPWMEALLIGDRKLISEDRFDSYFKLSCSAADREERFSAMKLRPPGPKDESQARDAVLRRDVLSDRLWFSFRSSRESPVKRTPVTGQYGSSSLMSHSILVWLSWQKVAPLLRTDLTLAERLAEQMAVANILLHEIMHAYGYATILINGTEPKSAVAEPYFEDETWAELGFSAENAFFGGVMTPFIGNANSETPHLAFHHREWPGTGMSHATELIEPPLNMWEICAPIPATFFEMVQSDGFWKTQFRNFGITKPTLPTAVSIRDRAGIDHWAVIARGVDGTFAMGNNRSPVDDLIDMTPEERAFHAKEMNTNNLHYLYQSLQFRDRVVTGIVDQGEICGRLMGPPRQQGYTYEVKKLVTSLILLLTAEDDCIEGLRRVEAGGKRNVDARNNILGFSRNLRKFIRTFKYTDDETINQSLRSRITELERSTLDLGLELSGTDNSDGALREEEQQKALLRRAHDRFVAGELEHCRRDCEALLDNLGISLYDKAIVRLLYSRLPLLSRNMRLQQLHRGVGTMRVLLALHTPENVRLLHAYEGQAAAIWEELIALGPMPVELCRTAA